MRDAQLKSIVLSALRREPDFSTLPLLRAMNQSLLKNLLRWLDQSGLALYFLERLQQHNAVDGLPTSLRIALESRLAANRQRTADMLDELRRITGTFTNFGVQFCALKGLSLVPDFCSAQHLRHQTDFDFLVSPEFLCQASRALESHGYVQQEVRASGEICFATPQAHIPSAQDDIYARQRHREVDLLPSLRLDFHGVAIYTPSDLFAHAQNKIVDNLSFPTLATYDIFSLQVLHAFSHILGSWVRLSWLLEIAQFLDLYHDDDALWHSVIERQKTASADNHNRNAFGLVLSLTRQTFPSHRQLPLPLREWCIEPVPLPIQAWVDHFGARFARAGLHGSKLTLFVHREFLDTSNAQGRRAWRRYAFGRILPLRGRSSIGNVSIAAPGAKIRSTVFQWLHSMRRALFHLRELVSLPVESIRLKRALRAFQRRRARTSRQSDNLHANSGSASSNALANLARLPD